MYELLYTYTAVRALRTHCEHVLLCVLAIRVLLLLAAVVVHVSKLKT